jgi:hypothetical protein
VAVEQRKRRAERLTVLLPRALQSLVVDVVTDEEERLPPVLRGAKVGLTGRHQVPATQRLVGE